MTAFCYKFISGYGSAEKIKIGQELPKPKLRTEVYCLIFMDLYSVRAWKRLNCLYYLASAVADADNVMLIFVMNDR